jgi:hypothetical protein
MVLEGKSPVEWAVAGDGRRVGARVVQVIVIKCIILPLLAYNKVFFKLFHLVWRALIDECCHRLEYLGHPLLPLLDSVKAIQLK